MTAIDLAPEAVDTVLAVLARHLPDRENRVMGGRVTGRAKRFSDLAGDQGGERRRMSSTPTPHR